uniref:Uncharacterized protein n=1 Tax=Anopheles coluzzii TaxID=1518534 RepID=A0A8W7P649_ANOCL
MDIVVLVALKICFILFLISGYYIARFIKQRRMAHTTINNPEKPRDQPQSTTIVPPPGAFILRHPTGTVTYPVYPTPYMMQQPHEQNMQQQQQFSDPKSSMPPPQANTLQFPELPPQMYYPVPPNGSAAMMNPPSYNQVVGDTKPVQAPYKG